MLNKEQCLQRIAKHRTDEIVVTTMGVTVPWAKLSTHPLDYASVGSAMGHAADFALGIALAKPEQRVLVLNGDGSMLMCLGTLATITALHTPPRNYILFVCDNGTYEVTGNQPIPRNTRFSWTAVAKAVGFERVYDFHDIDELDEQLPTLISAPGPSFAHLKIEQASEPPPDRWGQFPYPYLQESLAESTHKLRKLIE